MRVVSCGLVLVILLVLPFVSHMPADIEMQLPSTLFARLCQERAPCKTYKIYEAVPDRCGPASFFDLLHAV